MTDRQPNSEIQAALDDLKAYAEQKGDSFLLRLIEKAVAASGSGYVGRDSITAGPITGSTGVVIGSGSSASVIRRQTITIIQQPVHEAAAERLDELSAQKPAVSPELIEDAKAEVSTIDPALEAPDPEQEKWLEQRFRNLARMGPDILDVVTATFLNPVYGVTRVVQKIAEKARDEAGLEPVS